MTGQEQRIDKWLFFARIIKSRSLAQKLVTSGQVRINREKIANAAKPVRPGDVLTVTLAGRIRVLKVLGPGSRRGPASEAATLYEDLSPPPDAAKPEQGSPPLPPVPAPAGQPDRLTQRERRELDRIRKAGGDFSL